MKSPNASGTLFLQRCCLRDYCWLSAAAPDTSGSAAAAPPHGTTSIYQVEYGARFDPAAHRALKCRITVRQSSPLLKHIEFDGAGDRYLERSRGRQSRHVTAPALDWGLCRADGGVLHFEFRDRPRARGRR